MIVRKVVGKITEEEKQEIQSLSSKKNSLEELFKVLLGSQVEITNVNVYEKMLKDHMDVTQAFQLWWDKKSSSYGWESVPGGNWSINFETNEVTLNYTE